jgi:hypothetical protein
MKNKKEEIRKPLGKEIKSTRSGGKTYGRSRRPAPVNPNPKISGRDKVQAKNKSGFPGSGLPNIPCYTAPH